MNRFTTSAPRWVFPACVAWVWSLICLAGGATAEEPPLPVFQLDTVIQLAEARNPLIARAEGTIDETRGREITAGAYPNPTITGQTGRGAIRDPSLDLARTEYQIASSQPFEWYGKRLARREAAEAGVAGSSCKGGPKDHEDCREGGMGRIGPCQNPDVLRLHTRVRRRHDLVEAGRAA